MCAATLAYGLSGSQAQRKHLLASFRAKVRAVAAACKDLCRGALRWCCAAQELNTLGACRSSAMRCRLVRRAGRWPQAGAWAAAWPAPTGWPPGAPIQPCRTATRWRWQQRWPCPAACQCCWHPRCARPPAPGPQVQHACLCCLRPAGGCLPLQLAQPCQRAQAQSKAWMAAAFLHAEVAAAGSSADDVAAALQQLPSQPTTLLQCGRSAQPGSWHHQPEQAQPSIRCAGRSMVASAWCGVFDPAAVAQQMPALLGCPTPVVRTHGHGGKQGDSQGWPGAEAYLQLQRAVDGLPGVHLVICEPAGRPLFGACDHGAMSGRVGMQAGAACTAASAQ